MSVAQTEKWIFGKLSSDTVLSGLVDSEIYAYTIPQGAAYPLVNFALITFSDLQGMGTKRLASKARYFIKVVSKQNLTTDVLDTENRIDEIFQNVKAETANGYVFSSRRQQAISYEEKAGDADVGFRHLGGVYEIHVSKNE